MQYLFSMQDFCLRKWAELVPFVKHQPVGVRIKFSSGFSVLYHLFNKDLFPKKEKMVSSKFLQGLLYNYVCNYAAKNLGLSLQCRMVGAKPLNAWGNPSSSWDHFREWLLLIFFPYFPAREFKLSSPEISPSIAG